jgi:hypothetical protein
MPRRFPPRPGRRCKGGIVGGWPWQRRPQPTIARAYRCQKLSSIRFLIHRRIRQGLRRQTGSRAPCEDCSNYSIRYHACTTLKGIDGLRTVRPASSGNSREGKRNRADRPGDGEGNRVGGTRVPKRLRPGIGNTSQLRDSHSRPLWGLASEVAIPTRVGLGPVRPHGRMPGMFSRIL